MWNSALLVIVGLVLLGIITAYVENRRKVKTNALYRGIEEYFSSEVKQLKTQVEAQQNLNDMQYGYFTGKRELLLRTIEAIRNSYQSVWGDMKTDRIEHQLQAEASVNDMLKDLLQELGRKHRTP